MKILVPFSSHQLTTKNKKKLILSSPYISKTTGPCRIPTKVLKLLKNDISDQHGNLFHLSFITGTFPTIEVTPIYRKESCH